MRHVVDPFAEGETAHATPAETEHERATYQGNTPFAVWHPALTERVERLAVTNIPPRAMTVMESSHRFQATMKPTNSLKPSLAH